MRKMTRRDFLRWLAITSAATALPVSAAQNSQANVLVIGAGMAGLAAARSLNTQNTIVLEARNRIGGRVLTDYTLADHPVELGAEFIHGENVITWDELERYNLGAVPDNDGEEYLFFGGQLYDEAPDWLNEALEAVYDYTEEWVDEDEDDAPLSALYPDEYTAEMRRIVNNIMGPDYGADVDDLGIYGLVEASFAGDGDDDFRVRQGYSALVNAIATSLDIRLNSVVQRIDWGADGVRVIMQGGTTYDADYCIVTLPLAILQAGDVTFNPPLPAYKREAIQALGAGHVNKIMLKFSNSPLPREMDFLVTTGNSQMWWRAGFGQSRNVWLALVSGDAAMRHSRLSDTEIINEALQDIATALSLSAATLQNALAEGRVIRWSTDPFSKMGYSYVPVEGDGYRADLAEAIDNKLFFAGEATNVIRPGTVHGALESGIRTGDSILRLLR